MLRFAQHDTLAGCGDMRTYWVYIMTNRSKTLYTGVTGDLARRIYEHRHRLVPGFTSRYHIDRLVHAESFSEVRDAIAREKQIKGWVRAKKLALIFESNPDWRELGEEWFGPTQ
jgi:putative endonuclease